MGDWIKCSEEIPPDREQVILWDDALGEVTSGHYSHHTEKFYSRGMIVDNEITHWQPAPEPPEDV